jgi:hypothetical protein
MPRFSIQQHVPRLLRSLEEKTTTVGRDFIILYNAGGREVGRAVSVSSAPAAAVRCRATYASEECGPLVPKLPIPAPKARTYRPQTFAFAARNKPVIIEAETPEAAFVEFAHRYFDDGCEHAWAVFSSTQRPGYTTNIAVYALGSGSVDAAVNDIPGFARANMYCCKVSRSFHVHTHPSGTPKASKADQYALHGLHTALASSGITDHAPKGALVAMGNPDYPEWIEYEPEAPPQQFTTAQGTVDAASQPTEGGEEGGEGGEGGEESGEPADGEPGGEPGADGEETTEGGEEGGGDGEPVGGVHDDKQVMGNIWTPGE